MGVDQAIDITAEDRQTILELLDRHLPSAAAWVYGSRAQWTSRPESDLDLVVFATPEQRQRVGDLREAFEESNLPFRVDLFVWDDVPDSFRKQIEAEHLVLVRNAGTSFLDRPPHGWERSTLGAACEHGGGNIQTGPFGSQLHASDYRPIGIPSIMPQNLGDNRVIEDGIARIGELDAGRLARYLVRTGDIVYSRRGDVERRALIGHREDGWLCGTGCLRVRMGEAGVDPQYASYYLGHPVVREWIVRHAHGATMPNLNTAILSACPFLIPPVSEQRSIAHILGTLDEKIELNRRMNATLEAMAQALFKSWFVDFDPVRAKMEGRDTGLPKDVADLFPDQLVESELGETPDGWTVSEIGKEVDVVGGATPSTRESSYWNGPHNWATPKDLSKLLSPVLLGTNRTITDAGVQKISSGLLPAGTVLLSSRAPIGYLAIAEVPTAVNQGFIAMICRKRLPNLYVLFWCSENLEYIKDISGGSTFAEINKKTFRPLPVLVPPKGILEAYDDASRSLYDRVVLNTRESTLLVSLREILLPKLVSGEVRVPDAERLVKAVGRRDVARRSRPTELR